MAVTNPAELTVSMKGITKDNALKVLLRVRELSKAVEYVQGYQANGYYPTPSSPEESSKVTKAIVAAKGACIDLHRALVQMGTAALHEAVKGELSAEDLLKE